VADLALDPQTVGADVEAKHRAFALVGGQKPAHDADGGGLAGTVRPKEADDLAFRHAHRHMVDNGLVAEALDQAMDVDDVHWRMPSTCGRIGKNIFDIFTLEPDFLFANSLLANSHIDDLPRLQRGGVALRARLDQVDQLLP